MTKLAAFSDDFGKRIKTAVESIESGSVPPTAANESADLPKFTSPFEITAAFETDGQLLKGKGKRLWRIGGAYQTVESDPEVPLYAVDPSFSPGIGSVVFAMFRGVWEIISGGGGGTDRPTATVIEPLLCPLDRNAEPNPYGTDDNGFPLAETAKNISVQYLTALTMGTIALPEKEYKPIKATWQGGKKTETADSTPAAN